jgi:G:T-mismatch repair DNA endonuclease (very short patch repair protein)
VATRSKVEKEVVKELKNKGNSAAHSFKVERKIYDIYIPDLNMLIEFNGDYWHCNPKIYSATYFNVKRDMTAKQIWARDAKKKEVAIKNGYNYLVIWESDYRKSKRIIIKKIIQTNGRKRILHARAPRGRTKAKRPDHTNTVRARKF